MTECPERGPGVELGLSDFLAWIETGAHLTVICENCGRKPDIMDEESTYTPLAAIRCWQVPVMRATARAKCPGCLIPASLELSVYVKEIAGRLN